MAVSKETILLEFKINSKGVVTNVDQINSKLKQVGTSAKLAQKGFADMNSAAGIAGSTVTEFGRLVSDLPYGIQGVANNLSQLGSMFSLLVVQAGKMNNNLSTSRNVINLLKDQILGPVGILVAFQALIAGLEFFSKAQSKANQEVENFNESVFLQTEALDMLQQQLENTQGNEEERLRTLKVLALANKDYRKIIEDENLTITEKVRKGEVLLQQQRALNIANESLAKSQAIVSDNQEKGIITDEQLAKAKETLNNATKDNEAFGSQLATTLDNVDQATVSSAQSTIDLYNAQKNLAVQSEIIINIEKAKQNLLENGQEYTKGSIDDFKAQIKVLEEQRDAFATTSEQIKLYNDQIDRLRTSIKMLTDPAEEVQNVVNVITTQGPTFGKALTDQLAETIDPEKMQKDLEARFKGRKKQLDMTRLLGLKDQAQQMVQRAEMVKRIASSLNDILSAQADREIAIEENKTTKLNDQLKRRLANENLTAEERDKINQQIAKNEAALVEKQNAIAKKQFQREKALKIVMALSDTASSAAKAYLSQFMPVPDPTSPARGTVAAGIATAFGLAQVAAISRLKYTEQGMPTPNLTAQGSGGGAPAPASPAFNVIGSAGQSQLAQAVASQQRNPVKAYVVSGEVTTAQSLERNKIQEASI